jgi:hypothetical protein
MVQRLDSPEESDFLLWERHLAAAIEDRSLPQQYFLADKVAPRAMACLNQCLTEEKQLATSYRGRFVPNKFKKSLSRPKRIV